MVNHSLVLALVPTLPISVTIPSNMPGSIWESFFHVCNSFIHLPIHLFVYPSIHPFSIIYLLMECWYRNRNGIIACKSECVASPDPGISFSSSSCPSTQNSLRPCHWPPRRAARPARLCPCAVPETFLLLAGRRGSSRCTHSFQRSAASPKERGKWKNECKRISSQLYPGKAV